MTAARRARLHASLLVMAACTPASSQALPPVPYDEIVDTVRELAAETLGRKPEEVNTVSSLFSQALTEKEFIALMTSIQAEFCVAIPDDAIHQARYDDAVVALSVRRVADLVRRHMHEPH